MPGHTNKDRSAKRRIPILPMPASRHDPVGGLRRIAAGDAQRFERILHDVNNLLTVIVGSLDDLRTLGPFDPIVSERINEALEAALRGTELASRLLPPRGGRACR